MKIDFFVSMLAFVAVASNPIMKYSFCPLVSDCEPAIFASESDLFFGNITSGTLFYRPTEMFQLSVSCSFHEPIHWILTAYQNSRVISVSNSFTTNGSHRLYYYHIRFPRPSSGLIRCESYDNPDLAAEIYLAAKSPTPLNSILDLALEGFLVTPPNRNSQLTVPCVLSGFDQNLDPSASQLSKMKLSDMRSTVVNPKCLTCFPRTQAGSGANCNTSCPYDITQRVWKEAGKPLGVKITGNQWLDCISDDACAVKVIQYAPNLPKLPCNRDDLEWTCSDHYTSLSLYPNACNYYQWRKKQNNFKQIEACIVKNYARVFDATEANYDPRVGFRLKRERDMDSVYICNSTTQLTYLFPVNPNMRMDTRIQMSTRNMNESLKDFFCLVRTRSYELMDMTLVPCSTLFDCEIQLRTEEAFKFMRNADGIIRGQPMSSISSTYFGRIIQNPPRTGVLRCGHRNNRDALFILDVQYFFTGLDYKSYFISNYFPDEAVATLKNATDTLKTTNGFEVTVECTVANFVVFPNFEFLIEHSNGIIRNIHPKFGPEQQSTTLYHEVRQFISQRITIPLQELDSVVTIKCRAPFRNSTKMAQADLIVRSPLSESSEVDNSSELQISEVDNTSSLPISEVDNRSSLQISEVDHSSSLQISEVDNSSSLQISEVDNRSSLQISEMDNSSSLQISEVDNSSSPQISEVDNSSSLQISEVDNSSSLQISEVDNSSSLQISEVDNSSSLQISEMDNSSSPQMFYVIITTAATVLFIAGSFAGAVYAVRKYKANSSSTVDNMLDIPMSPVRNDRQDVRQLTGQEIDLFWNGHLTLTTVNYNNEVNMDAIGFPETFDIGQRGLQIHFEQVLGEGQFGRCFAGEFENRRVAVKTLKNSKDVDTFHDFLREVKIMVYLGKHGNIVEFLGVDVDQLKNRICFAAVELSPYGDLLSYLRNNDPENPNNAFVYANISFGCKNECRTALGLNHLSYFCEQIAAAMEYVVEKRVMHGDLAARNVLVFPDYVVKITDFGLSRKLYNAANYHKKSNNPLPWRWMAIESLKYMEFSPMSDMWAYGVTAWEVFTFGLLPHSGVVYSSEFVNLLDKGRRLPHPKNTPEEIYEFMKLTWNRIPSARPSFQDAKMFFRTCMMTEATTDEHVDQLDRTNLLGVNGASGVSEPTETRLRCVCCCRMLLIK